MVKNKEDEVDDVDDDETDDEDDLNSIKERETVKRTAEMLSMRNCKMCQP